MKNQNFNPNCSQENTMANWDLSSVAKCYHGMIKQMKIDFSYNQDAKDAHDAYLVVLDIELNYGFVWEQFHGPTQTIETTTARLRERSFSAVADALFDLIKMAKAKTNEAGEIQFECTKRATDWLSVQSGYVTTTGELSTRVHTRMERFVDANGEEYYKPVKQIGR